MNQLKQFSKGKSLLEEKSDKYKLLVYEEIYE